MAATTSELLTALTNARNTIRTKLVALGLVAATAKLADCATAIDGIDNNGAVSAQVKEGESYTIPKGYHSGTGKVSITIETKDATPTEKEQEITPTAGKVLSKVKVAPIPSKYKDVSGVTATADKVLDGAVFVDSTGAAVEGTMVNQGAKTLTIDGLTKLSVTIPAGYHDGTGTVSLTDDIRVALAAI